NSNNIGELEHPVVFHQQDAVDLSTSGFYGLKSSNVAFPSSIPFGSVNPDKYMGGTAEEVADAEEFLVARKAEVVQRRKMDKWGESTAPAPVAMGGDGSQHTDTSTDLDTDDRIQVSDGPNETILTV
ncbi:hypothetical protein KSS87_019950, partial [Heliosperma pusillum]